MILIEHDFILLLSSFRELIIIILVCITPDQNFKIHGRVSHLSEHLATNMGRFFTAKE